MSNSIKRILIVSLILLAFFIMGYISNRPRDNEVNIVAVGDILLDRGVREVIEIDGYDYPYENVKDIFNNRDIVLGNLECPIYEGDNPVYKSPDIVFKADLENGRALSRAGINLLNLANNHSMDYRSNGLLSTMHVLGNNNIKYFGAGKDDTEAKTLKLIQIKGTTIGFLGYSTFPTEGYIYFPNRPDVARAHYGKIEEEIKEAKEQCDFLIISYHWGQEYDYYPSEEQINLAHISINAGGDLILGHHPHVLQGVERYKDKYIFYSLGNFIFDRQIQNGTDETVIVDLRINSKQLSNIELIPIRIVDCQPRVAKKEEGERILNRVKKLSRDKGVSLTIKDGVGTIVNVN